MRTATARKISVLAATVAVCCLLGALGWFLRTPEYTTSRLVLFTILGGAGVLALYGIVIQRGIVASAGIVALFLLGFWQAVLWIVIYPVIAVLLLAMLVGDTETTTGAAETE